MTLQDAFIRGRKSLALLGWLLLKFPLQWAGGVNRPDIFVESFAGHRYPVYLALALISRFRVEVRPQDFLFLRRYLSLRDFLFQTAVVWPGRKPTAPVILGQGTEKPFSSKFTVPIDEDYYSEQKRATHLVMPYFAHPGFYQARLHLQAPFFQAGPRRFRIFFCGTVAPNTYSRAFRFPLLNRSEILDDISAHFADQIATSLQGPAKPITLVTTADERDILEKHALPLPAYFQALGEADFFIAPPGWRMPHSHNLIEAMTAGAIPITNYAHYFDPPLQDGVNCLSFRSLEDLDRAIRFALAMPAEQVNELRRGVMAYYRQHLAPEAFGASFQQRLSPSLKLLVNGESILP